MHEHYIIDIDVLRRLRDRRKALGMSQRQLAAAMRTHQSAISDFESGKFNMQLSTLDRWAACLGFQVRIGLDDTHEGVSNVDA